MEIHTAPESLTSLSGGLDLIPRTTTHYQAKDFASDQEIRWCPGCGDYPIINTVRSVLPDLNIPRENIVFISGIGCSSRFPYYMNTYGIHSVHGRGPTFITGLVSSRPDLTVFLITGDGDSLSIGGNHLIHLLRRNLNVVVLMFNNRIYGLTKGQYSPTSEQGKITKSTPYGSLDTPFNPTSLALGAEATFVGRALDSDRKALAAMIKAAIEHRGTGFVEILQDCPIFNNGSFDSLRQDTHHDHLIPLETGKELIFGDGQFCVVGQDSELRIARVEEVKPEEIVIHDPTRPNPSYAFGLSRLSHQDLSYFPMGLFRQVSAPTYDDLLRDQVAKAQEYQPHDWQALQDLLYGQDTWTVE